MMKETVSFLCIWNNSAWNVMFWRTGERILRDGGRGIACPAKFFLPCLVKRNRGIGHYIFWYPAEARSTTPCPVCPCLPALLLMWDKQVKEFRNLPQVFNHSGGQKVGAGYRLPGWICYKLYSPWIDRTFENNPCAYEVTNQQDYQNPHCCPNL